MSMIEKAARKYKKKSIASPDDNKTRKVSTSAGTPNESDIDKTVLLNATDNDSNEENVIDIDKQTEEYDHSVDNTQDTDTNTDSDDLSDDLSDEDETLFPEEDITDISGFEGFSVKAKKSRHSNNIHLDLNKLNSDGFLSPKHPDTALSSTYRMIKRPLLNNAKGKSASIVEHPNLIQITSSFANEGKTYSAINIAISIAMEQDLHVLLIDADIRKPSLAKTFGIEVEQGLTDYLSGEVRDMKDILYNTNIPSLTLMCSGKHHPNGTELLSSESMEEFVKEIATRYSDRVIIFDSPPLLQTTESSVLASHMGQVVLVVEAETTLAPHISKGLEILQNEIVLLLLNKQREKKDDINYGYGYGY